MQSLDFVLVVVPLTIIVATLTGVIFYLARREEFEEHKRTVAVQKFLGVRSKQQALIRQELEKLKSQHESGIVDDVSYDRLLNVIFMTQEKLRCEASVLLNEKNGVLSCAQLSVQEVRLEQERDSSMEPEIIHEEQEVCEVPLKSFEKVSSQLKRKAKGQQVGKGQSGEKKELQMGMLDKDNTPVEPKEKERLVSE
jgi:hypothetical protein